MGQGTAPAPRKHSALRELTSSCGKNVLVGEAWRRNAGHGWGSANTAVVWLDYRKGVYERTSWIVGWDHITCSGGGTFIAQILPEGSQKPSVAPLCHPGHCRGEGELGGQADAVAALQGHLQGQPLYPLLGFFPLVISLEFKRNTYPEMPEPTVLSLLWR